MRRRTTVAALAATLLGAGAAAALAPMAGATTARTPAAMTTHVERVGNGYITTTIMPNGDTMKVYGGVAYTPAAPQAIEHSAVVGGGTQTAVAGRLDPPAGLDKSSVATTSVGAGDVTPEQELLALGASPADAAPFAGLADGPHLADGGGPLAAHAATRAAPITKPVCVSVSGDGGLLHVYGCDSTYKVATSGAVWCLEDKFQASGTMHDSSYFDPDEITGLKFGVSYGSGNQISTWSPGSISDIGNCTTKTSEVDYKGAKAATSTTECPETFGLYSQNATHFGTKWDGQGDGPSDGARATHGVDGVYNGASASPYPVSTTRTTTSERHDDRDYGGAAGMIAAGTRPVEPVRSTKPSKPSKRVLVVAGVLFAVLAVGAAGWGLHAATHRDDTLTTGDRFTGRVTLVNVEGNAGCIRPDSGGRPVCSDFAIVEGAHVQVGSRVTAIPENVHTGGGNGFHLLLVYAPGR